MPAKVKNPKESRLSIRASSSEKAILAEAARARNMNTSVFVLRASLDAAQVVLEEQTEFYLSPDQWETFCRRLDEPPGQCNDRKSHCGISSSNVST